jgi:tetratricopeptide (TPR) repeat protein
MKSKTSLPKKPSQAKQKVHREVIDTLPKWTPFALMLFTFLLYTKALVNGITNFDDDFYIVNNPYLKDFSWNGVNAIFSSFYQANYHPFTTMIYFFEYNWFGLNPLPYHLLNVLLHVLNVFLVFKFVERLSGKQMTALIVAVLFAVHPLHVESVAWISELKDVLYSCFFLLSMLAYLRYMKSGFQMRDYWASLLLFLASLFSKSAAVTLPLLLIAIDIYKGRKLNTKSILEKLPFILLSLLFGVLTMLSQKAQGSINVQMFTFNPITRFFFLTSAISFYFIKLILPFGLSSMNYYPILHNGILPWQYYASILVIFFVIWFTFRKSPIRKEITFGVSFFIISISVMLQIISVGSALTAERYTYISYIGLFYILGQWITSLASGQRKNTVIGILCFLILVFSVQTFARISVWQNGNTIDEDIIEHNPNVYIGYWMRGNLKRTQSDFQGALQDYSKAIKLDPFSDDSYYNRGNIYDRLGDPKSAIPDYNQAIKLNPKLADSYNNRGWAYFETGDSIAALTDIDKAISINPRYVQAYNNRGWIKFKAGNAKEALPDFEKAIEIQPEFLTAYYNRALVKIELKDYDGAIADYSFLSKRRPKDSNIYYNMGIIYLDKKDTADACRNWNYAISMGSNPSRELAEKYCH